MMDGVSLAWMAMMAVVLAGWVALITWQDREPHLEIRCTSVCSQPKRPVSNAQAESGWGRIGLAAMPVGLPAPQFGASWCSDSGWWFHLARHACQRRSGAARGQLLSARQTLRPLAMGRAAGVEAQRRSPPGWAYLLPLPVQSNC